MNEKNEGEEAVIMLCMFGAGAAVVIPVLYVGNHFRWLRRDISSCKDIHKKGVLVLGLIAVILAVATKGLIEIRLKRGLLYFDLYYWYLTAFFSVNFAIATLLALSRPLWIKLVKNKIKNEEKQTLF